MLEHMGESLKGKHVRVCSDNTTAVACVGKGGSVRSKPCQQDTEAIWALTEAGQITISIIFCPGAENTEADWASKAFTDIGEWALDKHIAGELLNMLGKPVFDMTINCYVTSPETMIGKPVAPTH